MLRNRLSLCGRAAWCSDTPSDIKTNQLSATCKVAVASLLVTICVSAMLYWCRHPRAYRPDEARERTDSAMPVMLHIGLLSVSNQRDRIWANRHVAASIGISLVPSIRPTTPPLTYRLDQGAV